MPLNQGMYLKTIVRYCPRIPPQLKICSSIKGCGSSGFEENLHPKSSQKSFRVPNFGSELLRRVVPSLIKKPPYSSVGSF